MEVEDESTAEPSTAEVAADAAADAAAQAVEQHETAQQAERAEVEAQAATVVSGVAEDTAAMAAGIAVEAGDMASVAEETANGAVGLAEETAAATVDIAYATADALDALNARVAELESRPHLLHEDPPRTGQEPLPEAQEPETIPVKRSRAASPEGGSGNAATSRRHKFGNKR